MSTPRRWLEGAIELSELEREVLSAGVSVRPPAGAKQAVHAAIAAASGAGAAIGGTTAKLARGVGSVTQAAGAGSATTLVFLKGLGLGLVLGTVVAGGVVSFSSSRVGTSTPRVVSSSHPAVRRAASEQRAVVPESGFAPSPEPTLVSASAPSGNAQHSMLPLPAPSDVIDPALNASAPSGTVAFPDLPPAPAAITSAAMPTSSTTVLAESRAVADARSLLRSGDARGALNRLQALQHDFPGGILNQERDALEIEALLAAGNSSAASERAKVFLTRYPKSPHAAAAWRALQQP